MNPQFEDTEQRAISLMLFVAGNSPRSNRAVRQLNEALETRGIDPSAVEVVDALRQPRVALEYRIFATPALIARPLSDGALYGDLSDREALDRFLDGML